MRFYKSINFWGTAAIVAIIAFMFFCLVMNKREAERCDWQCYPHQVIKCEFSGAFCANGKHIWRKPGEAL